MITAADVGHGAHLEEDFNLDTLALTSTDNPALNESTATVSKSACSRKRKADDEVEAVECCPTPVKRRFESQFSADELEIEDDTLPCWCTKWVSLKTDLTKSLEHWQRHILTCQHFKRKDTTSLGDILRATIGLLSPKMIGGSNMTIDNQLKDGSLVSTDMSGSIQNNEELENTGVHYAGWEEFTSALEPGAKLQGLRRRKRPNRTEAERVQDFLDDPQVKEIEPYRVLCRTCNKWIKLRNNSRYCSIPWKCHKSSCKKNDTPTGSGNPISAGTSGNTSWSKDEIIDTNVSPPSEPNTDFKVPPANTHPSLQIHLTTLDQPSTSKSASKVRRPRLTDAENRKAILEADSNAETVEPHRVLCALCKKWVKLRPNSTYCSAPWQSHIRRCIARSDRKASKAASAMNSKREESSSGTTLNDSEGESAITSCNGNPGRRGRPPKNLVTRRQARDGTESDNSYESEEEQ